MIISEEQSRVLHLHSLMLWEEPGKIKPLDIIKKLSYLQIDAIYSIARSQDVVLHNRSALYQEKDIWKLLKTNKVFEGFAHPRCLLPLDQLPYYYVKMLRKREQTPNWYKSVSEEMEWQAEILETAAIKKEISIRDIAIPKNFPKFTGWTHPPKRMLDYLSTSGEPSDTSSDNESTAVLNFSTPTVILFIMLILISHYRRRNNL